MTIIQVYSIDLIFFDQFKKFIQQQIPSLFLSVIKNGSFFVVHSSALTSIKIIFTAFFINCHEFKMLIFLAHSWRTYSCKAVNYQFDVVLFKVMDKLFKFFLASQKRRWNCSVCNCNWWSLWSFETMLKLSIISFKDSW